MNETSPVNAYRSATRCIRRPMTRLAAIDACIGRRMLDLLGDGLDRVEAHSRFCDVQCAVVDLEQVAATTLLHPLHAGRVDGRDRHHGHDAELEVAGVAAGSFCQYGAEKVLGPLQLFPDACPQ